MSVKVLRDNTVFGNEVLANGGGLLSAFSHALVQVPESITYTTCITRVTLNSPALQSLGFGRLCPQIAEGPDLEDLHSLSTGFCQ